MYDHQKENYKMINRQEFFKYLNIAFKCNVIIDERSDDCNKMQDNTKSLDIDNCSNDMYVDLQNNNTTEINYCDCEIDESLQI